VFPAKKQALRDKMARLRTLRSSSRSDSESSCQDPQPNQGSVQNSSSALIDQAEVEITKSEKDRVDDDATSVSDADSNSQRRSKSILIFMLIYINVLSSQIKRPPSQSVLKS
jgi:hypothetical protein